MVIPTTVGTELSKLHKACKNAHITPIIANTIPNTIPNINARRETNVISIAYIIPKNSFIN